MQDNPILYAGLDVSQLKSLVIKPSLEALGLCSPAAVNLMTGTALAESRAAYLHQLGGGPALGLWQMEPETHDDCWKNFLNFPAQSKFATALHRMIAADLSPVEQLVGNLRYACAMARIKYYRSPRALPEFDDADALSVFHKTIYNSNDGAADAADNIPLFAAAIAA